MNQAFADWLVATKTRYALVVQQKATALQNGDVVVVAGFVEELTRALLWLDVLEQCQNFNTIKELSSFLWTAAVAPRWDNTAMRAGVHSLHREIYAGCYRKLKELITCPT